MKRRKRSEVRQAEIARAVLELIAAEGHEALSMVAVAKRVKVVPSALYRHFASKEDMILAALRYQRDERLSEFNAAMQAGGSVLDAFETLARHVTRRLPTVAAIPRIVFGLLPKASERLRAESRALLNGLLGNLASGLKAAQERGEVRQDVDCEVAAMNMWGIFLTAIVRWHVSGHEFDVETYIARAFSLFRRSVEEVG